MNNFTAINEPGQNQVLQKKNEQEMSKKVFIYIYLKFDCLRPKKSKRLITDQGQIFASTYMTSVKIYAYVKDEKFSPDKKCGHLLFLKMH